jgi:hypothetical protein
MRTGLTNKKEGQKYREEETNVTRKDEINE